MSSTYTYIPNLPEQIPDIPDDSIVSRTVYSDAQSKAILFAFAPGQELSEHTTPQVASLYFIQGDADITLGDDALTARAGTWVHMPPQLPHSVVAKTSVVMLLLLLKTSTPEKS